MKKFTFPELNRIVKIIEVVKSIDGSIICKIESSNFIETEKTKKSLELANRRELRNKFERMIGIRL